MATDGADIRERRIALGYTQEEVAAKADIELMTLSRIETGRTRHPKRMTIGRILNALDRMPRREPPRKLPDIQPRRHVPRGDSQRITEARLNQAIAKAMKRVNAWQEQIAKRLADGPATIEELHRRTGIDPHEIRACLCILKHRGRAECRMVRTGLHTARQAYWCPKGWREPQTRRWPNRINRTEAEAQGMHVET